MSWASTADRRAARFVSPLGSGKGALGANGVSSACSALDRILALYGVRGPNPLISTDSMACSHAGSKPLGPHVPGGAAAVGVYGKSLLAPRGTSRSRMKYNAWSWPRR
jgi:hypothetical protein